MEAEYEQKLLSQCRSFVSSNYPTKTYWSMNKAKTTRLILSGNWVQP